jgi:GT2 family glycosyltransferase
VAEAARTRLSVVIVTHNEREPISRSIPALLRELEPGDELIVSDNASTDGCRELVSQLAPEATVLDNAENLGFPAAVNAGAAVATGELLVLLNPDAVVTAGWREALLRPLRGEPAFDAWMALVTMEQGRLVNTSGGEIHFTGISWAGGIGRRVEEVIHSPREVPFASGACLAIRLSTWRELRGMPGEFFLYFDDVDLSLRLRLMGRKVGIEPAARVDHHYEFGKGARKWRMLERNRWATVLRTYPAPLLAALAPALAASELGLLAISVTGGWGRQKLLATADVLRALPRLLRERRAIQTSRRISAGEFASWLSPELSSPYLGRVARLPPLRLALRSYWALVKAVLRG